MSTKRLRKKQKKSAVASAFEEMSNSKKAMRTQAHVFMCHGFFSHVEYIKVINRIGDYYNPLLKAFKKRMEEEDEMSSM